MNCSHLSRGTYASALVALLASVACGACSGGAGNGFGDAATGIEGGAEPHDGQTPSADAGIPHEGGSTLDTSLPDTGAHDTSAPDTSPVDTGVDMGTVTSSDGFGAARTACINAINTLRAMQKLAPYTLINTDPIDTCLDQQATTDESMDSPHYSFINDTYPACGYPPFNAQDECEGYGNDPGAPGSGPHGTHGTGIVGCLYDMWAEQYNSNCLGCVGCAAFGGACSDCDYSGMMGPECGHYVNMSASYFSMAACGFATGTGTWATQNFY